ncbi:acyl-CoA thioesterase [Methylobacterium organophilum]|uniref:acyl-CoA thioesterase n=1 Tax=Methylobacterium organophilum TaxID=410 RepID=UPI001F130BE0|nr:thioesterase family protein [Methylobacterium organophilum]UMY19764.1 acyl-CoA thioesterase [Methylobacterium organophilum]
MSSPGGAGARPDFAQLSRSVSWAPTIGLSWLWGLGFFYAFHVTLTYGWLGFLAFALPNAFGLFLFGWLLGAPGRDPAKVFRSAESGYAGLFLLGQLGAVAITLFAFVAYLWLPLSGASPAVAVGLLVLVACAVGHAVPIARLRFLHLAYLVVGVAAALIALAALRENAAAAPLPLAAFDGRFYGLVLPSLVGFLLGPWTDVQQWQRAVEIHRGGGSVRAAYTLGALIFLGLLVLNALLAAAAGPEGSIVAADGVAGAQAAVTLAFLQHPSGIGLAAYVTWVVIAALSTIDGFYAATRWWLTSATGRSVSPLLAIIPAGFVASPLWIVLAALAVATAMVSAKLSMIYLMLPYATVLVGAAACLVGETLGAPRRYDAMLCWLIGVTAALIFLLGYVAPSPALLALSPLLALLGAIPTANALFGGPEPAPAAAPAATASPEAKVAVLTVSNTDAAASFGFDGQWFVMHLLPTYDDTNSVGNVYFANYVRWVGKAREMFFNICMPDFDLKTTSYYILTRNFQHEFRREAMEFEPVTVRIRIAKHNRKFVTLAHEIHSETHGLLGRGEQSLMFVDVKTYHPLDIPGAIIQGFLRYWPKESPHSGDRPNLPGDVGMSGDALLM